MTQGSPTSLESHEKVQDFLLKEAEQIRTMHCDSIKEIGGMEKLALVATGGLWSWWFAHAGSNPNVKVLYLLLLFHIFAGVRAFSVFIIMRSDRQYLERLETRFCIPAELGWGRDRRQDRIKFRTWTGFAFWLLLLAVTIYGIKIFT